MRSSIFILPLINTIVLSLFGRLVGSEGAIRLSISCLSFSFLAAIVGLIPMGPVATGQTAIVPYFLWLDTGLLNLRFALSADPLAIVMLALTSGISLLVHLYSSEYLQGDPHQLRFFAWLQGFTASMLCLVVSPSGLILFIGWELIGIFSFLLISFWYTRIAAATAGVMAMVVNRVGDLFLCQALFLTVATSETTDWSVINGVAPLWSRGELGTSEISELIAVLLVLGVIGKSAQFPFHIWLPFSMNGPTPVSSLIHTSTLVTAGIFVLLRGGPIIEAGGSAGSRLITLIGSITALLGGTIAVVTFDIKGVIAYSTISQLAYLMLAIGGGLPGASFFHLVIHGLFKAGLFLAAGSVIHAMGGSQDIRTSAQLLKSQPLTWIGGMAASAALMGIPFTGGFYSKDFIIEGAAVGSSLGGTYIFWIGCIGAAFTGAYAFRLGYHIFLGTPNSPWMRGRSLEGLESGIRMLIPICTLAGGATIGGYFLNQGFTGLNPWRSELGLGNSNAQGIEAFGAGQIDPHILTTGWKFSALVAVIFGVTFCWLLIRPSAGGAPNYHSRAPRRKFFFLLRSWRLDQLSNSLIGRWILAGGHDLAFKLIDRGFLENYGPQGIFKFFNYRLSLMLMNIQGGTLPQKLAGTSGACLIGLVLFLAPDFFF